MPELVTIRVESPGGLVHARSAAELQTQARAIADQFANETAPLRDGLTLWFGWGPVVLREAADGWMLRAPDYAGDPRGETDDLSLTIWVTVSLIATASTARVEPTSIAYTDDVILVRDALVAPLISMTRARTNTAGDSGWFIEPFPPTADRERSADRLERMPAWRVLKARRDAVRAMSLPAGVSAIVEPDSIRVIVRDSDRSVLASGPL